MFDIYFCTPQTWIKVRINMCVQCHFYTIFELDDVSNSFTGGKTGDHRENHQVTKLYFMNLNYWKVYN